MKKILILGGTGFLGQHVNNLIDKKQYEVFSISRRENLDLMNLEALKAKLTEIKPDVIMNYAADVGSVQYVIQYAADTIYKNIQIIINIYEGVKSCCPEAKIINPFSNCSYPGDADIQIESQWQNGPVHDSVLAYGTTKRILYAVSECYRKQYGIKSVNWLISNAYGPGDYVDPNKVHALNGIIIRLIQAQNKGDREFEIWGTGSPIREWTYIEDVAKIFIQSLNIDEQIYPLNLAQNKGYSIAEIAALAAQALDFDVRLVFNPKYPDGAPIKILSDQEFRKNYPDFRFTPLDLGISNTIKYYKEKIK